MSRHVVCLGFALALLSLGCDTTTQTADPFEVSFIVDNGASQRVALTVDVPRNALDRAPLALSIPESATGARVETDLVAGDSVGLVTIVTTERFDATALPFARILTGTSRRLDLQRGLGGAFRPVVVFSTDSLWAGSRASANVRMEVGAESTSRVLSRAEAVVPAALRVGSADLGLGPDVPGGEGRAAEVRVVVRGTRNVIGMVAVLVAEPVDVLSGETTYTSLTEARVLYPSVVDRDRFVISQGNGIRALDGGEEGDPRSFALYLFRTY